MGCRPACAGLAASLCSIYRSVYGAAAAAILKLRVAIFRSHFWAKFETWFRIARKLLRSGQSCKEKNFNMVNWINWAKKCSFFNNYVTHQLYMLPIAADFCDFWHVLMFCAVSDWHHLSTDAALYCFMISERDYGWCCEYVSMQQNDASVHSFVSELNKCAKTQLSSVTFFILCDILYFTFWWVELGGIGIWAVLRCLSTGSGFDHACFCCLSSKSLCLRSCLVVWLSGNTLALINVVALCQTRLVSGWVTVCRWVNHLGM